MNSSSGSRPAAIAASYSAFFCLAIFLLIAAFAAMAAAAIAEKDENGPSVSQKQEIQVMQVLACVCAEYI